MVVTPVVAFYLIYDWHRMIRTVDSWVPLQQRETVRQLAREIDAAIAGFVRGQTAVCLILGSFYAVALTLSGLNFGLLIGLISGLITFIPYVGSMTGLILALGVAVAQFWPDYSSILMVLGIFLVGQFLEGNLLAPKLVGESVGLHPVWLIFALLAFGYLFGFVGLLVAVPLAATIGVLARFALQRYLAKLALYRRDSRVERHGRSSLGPRQLVLALDHADSFAREDFLRRPVERRGAGADRALAGLAGPHHGADRAGRLGQEPSRRDLGGGGRRARAGGETAASTPICRRPWRPARWWSRISSRRASTSARCSICSISRARRAPLCCSPRARRRPTFPVTHPRSRLAPARAAGGRAGRRPTTRCCAR